MKEAECLEIAERIKRDAGVRSHIPNFKPGTYGIAVPAYRLVGAPPGRTPRELYILAHECGHVRYQHVNDPVTVWRSLKTNWRLMTLHGAC